MVARTTFGAGTIIGGQDATPSLSCNSAHGCTHGCTYYRGTRSHWLRDMSPTYRILRAAALPPIGGTTSGIPPLCALVRSGLSTGAVGMLTARCVTSPSESQRCLESLQRRQEPTRCPPSGTIDSSNRADISLDPMLSRLSTTNRPEPVLVRTRLGSLRQCLLRGHCPSYTSMNSAGS